MTSPCSIAEGQRLPRRAAAPGAMMSEARRHQVLVEWNQTQMEYPLYFSSSRFERSGADTGGRGPRHRTADELSIPMSEPLNWAYLRQRGVGPRSCRHSMERRVEWWSFAGGLSRRGLCPVDAYPWNGSYMVEQRAQVVLTQAGLGLVERW